MGDFTAYIQRLYDIQKNKVDFDSELEPALKQRRVKETIRQRKENRDQVLSRRRRISKKIEVIEEEEVTQTTTKAMSRLERLAQWKAERERKKIEAARKMKPIFKVHSITTTIGLPNLENVNRQIKGKLFTNENSQFAPANHQFKPPANIKPIYFGAAEQSSKITVNSTGVRTRSQARNAVTYNENLRSNPAPKRLKTDNNSRKLDTPQNRNNTQTKNSKTVPHLPSEKKTSNNRTTPNVSNVKENSVDPTQQVPEINEKTPSRKTRNRNKTHQKSVERTSNRSPRKLPKTTESAKTEDTEAGTNEDKDQIKEIRRDRITTRRSVAQSNGENTIIHENNDISTTGGIVEKISRKTAKTLKSVQIEQSSSNGNTKTGIKDDDLEKNRKTKRGKRGKSTTRKNPDSTTANMNDKDIINETEANLSNQTTKTPESNQAHKTKTKTPKDRHRTRQNQRITTITIYQSSENNEGNETTEITNENDQTITDNTKKLDESIKTPIKQSVNHHEDTTVYISPFVTISRGKDRARKEYAERQSRTDFSPNDDGSKYTSPKAAACYFTRLLKNNIHRLEAMNDEWTKYKESESLSEDAQSLIDVAIGQSKLLIKEKFQQFQNLIDTCTDPDNPEPIKCTDLHGFWDLLYIQIRNIMGRYENLERMKSNNWNELQPEIKKPQTKRMRLPKQKPAQATSVLRQAIQAARKKKQQQTDEVIVEIVAPSVNAPLPETNNRKSLLNSVQKSETKSRRTSSPGLTMMKVTRMSRSFATPSKGILRSDAGKSTGKSKSVVFQEDSNNENDLNRLNQEPSDDDDKTFIRRSSRLSKSKLF